MHRVSGIGGFFFRARDRSGLAINFRAGNPRMSNSYRPRPQLFRVAHGPDAGDPVFGKVEGEHDEY
jgi:hypothetical protein